MNITEYGKSVLVTEGNALLGLADRIDSTFAKAAKLILQCSGNVIVGGVGKPWFIAQKISASMTSTGTPSFALHPSDAAHGDVGCVRENDIVILLSNSGNSEEITRILPILKQMGSKLIAITGNASSILAQHSDVLLCYGSLPEACPLGLAPSTSSTVMLALGDALTLAVLSARDFGPEDYARYHPAGSLGRKLMKVSQLMRRDIPTVGPRATVWDALNTITSKRAGAVFITKENVLLGIFTDGDLRRVLSEKQEEVLRTPVCDYMTCQPITIGSDRLISDAVRVMKKNKIDELPVLGSDGSFVGYLDIQDVLGLEFSVDH